MDRMDMTYIEILVKKNKQLEVENIQLKEEVQYHDKRCTSLLYKLEDYEKDNESLRDDLHAVIGEKEELEEEMKAIDDSNDHLIDKNEELNYEIYELKKKLVEEETDYNDLRVLLTETEEALEEERQEKFNYKNYSEVLEDKIDNLEDEIEELNKQIEHLKSLSQEDEYGYYEEY